MSVRIGWGSTKPRAGRNTGVHAALFQYAKVKNRHGRSFVLGLQSYRNADLKALTDKELVMDLRVIGVLRFARDVTPALLDEAIGSVHVTGPVVAQPSVRRALVTHSSRPTRKS